MGRQVVSPFFRTAGKRCLLKQKLNLPTNLMLKLLIIPHPDPAEFFC